MSESKKKKSISAARRLLNDEFAECRERHGEISAKSVLEFAKNPETHAHNYFDWDDSVAGPKWRMHQARALIRFVLDKEPTPSGELVRGFISLPEDRKTTHVYRPIREILSNEAQRAQLVQMAIDELQSVRRKHATITELANVWQAVDAASVKHAKKGGSKKAG